MIKTFLLIRNRFVYVNPSSTNSNEIIKVYVYNFETLIYIFMLL